MPLPQPVDLHCYEHLEYPIFCTPYDEQTQTHRTSSGSRCPQAHRQVDGCHQDNRFHNTGEHPNTNGHGVSRHTNRIKMELGVRKHHRNSHRRGLLVHSRRTPRHHSFHHVYHECGNILFTRTERSDFRHRINVNIRGRSECYVRGRHEVHAQTQSRRHSRLAGGGPSH